MNLYLLKNQEETNENILGDNHELLYKNQTCCNFLTSFAFMHANRKRWGRLKSLLSQATADLKKLLRSIQAARSNYFGKNRR